jgi:hypothetical protein
MDVLSVISLLPGTQEEAEKFVSLIKNELLAQGNSTGSGLTKNLIWGSASLMKLLQDKEVGAYINSHYLYQHEQ